jgi:hypothetical protein
VLEEAHGQVALALALALAPPCADEAAAPDRPFAAMRDDEAPVARARAHQRRAPPQRRDRRRQAALALRPARPAPRRRRLRLRPRRRRWCCRGGGVRADQILEVGDEVGVGRVDADGEKQQQRQQHRRAWVGGAREFRVSVSLDGFDRGFNPSSSGHFILSARRAHRWTRSLERFGSIWAGASWAVGG